MLYANTALGQAESANNQLAAFFNELSKYLVDNTGSIPPPDFQDVVDTLDYSELLRLTSIRSKDAASYENGASIENVHQMASVLRDFGMASKRKTDYYRDAGSEANRESNFYTNMKVFWVSMLKGNYVEGATS